MTGKDGDNKGDKKETRQSRRETRQTAKLTEEENSMEQNGHGDRQQSGSEQGPAAVAHGKHVEPGPMDNNTTGGREAEPEVTGRGGQMVGQNELWGDEELGLPQDVAERQLLVMIWNKVSKMDDIGKAVDNLSGRVNTVENKQKCIETSMEEMKKGVEYVEELFEQQREAIKRIEINKTETTDFAMLKKQVVDLSNRSRRHNVVLYNIPEGEEGDDYDCVTFVKSFFKRALELETGLEIAIDAAHRTNWGKEDSRNEARPRPIHAHCVFRNDRERILREAPAKLRRIKIKGMVPYVSDDIDPETRAEHN